MNQWNTASKGSAEPLIEKGPCCALCKRVEREDMKLKGISGKPGVSHLFFGLLCQYNRLNKMLVSSDHNIKIKYWFILRINFIDITGYY